MNSLEQKDRGRPRSLFLSSVVRGRKCLRRRIKATVEATTGAAVWVDEIDDFRTSDAFDPALIAVDGLFGKINGTDLLVILLLNPDRGSNLRIGESKACTTYWESELFYAALRDKPTVVIRHRDFQAGPELSALLRLLQRDFPSDAWRGPFDDDAIVSECVRLSEQGADIATTPGLVGRVVDRFRRLRSRRVDGGRAENSKVVFLHEHPFDTTVRPNLDLAQEMLTVQGSEDDHEKRLSRLWIAFRELSGAPYPKNREALPLWNRFFGEWTSAASWHGLHSHGTMSVYAAAIHRAKVSELMRQDWNSQWDPASAAYPGGSLASAQYSISRLGRSWWGQRMVLTSALRDLEVSLADGLVDATNLKAIRGSVYRELWAISRAVADFEFVLRDRMARGASLAQVGEAHSELGLGYVYQIQLGKGLSHMNEAVMLLRTPDVPRHALARALRKLAFAQAITGHLSDARHSLDESISAAAEVGALDQVRSSSFLNRLLGLGRAV